MTKRLFRTNISTFVAESASDKARATKKRKVGRLDGCFDRNTNFFSRVRSARYDDRVAEIIRDRHLEEWLLFKDAEQRIYAQSSSSRQRVFHSSRRCFFLFFFLFPLFFFFISPPSLLQNLLCRYTMLLIDLDQSSINLSIVIRARRINLAQICIKSRVERKVVGYWIDGIYGNFIVLVDNWRG